MQAHVDHLFLTAPDGLVELSWTNPISGSLSYAQQFSLLSLGDLVAKAATVNVEPGCNVYIGAALRQTNSPLMARAGDNCYFGTVAVYADLDDPDTVKDAVAKVEACKPTFIVRTGKEPHWRAQLWWKLDKPFGDPDQHRRLCGALAAALGGDPVVVNPSRVMRLAGSIAWPHKPGRVTEMTSILPVKGGTPTVSLEALQAAYPAGPAVLIVSNTSSPLPAAPTVETVYQPAPPSPVRSAISGRLNTDECLRQIRSGNQWHNHVNQLIGNWVMRGLSDAEILALAPSITLPGYTVDQTVREMQQSIEGARRKWQKPNPLNDFDETAPAGVLRPRILNEDQINDLSPPTYCIDKLVTERGFTLIWGKQASYKSFMALDMSMHLAYGQPYHGRETLPKTILYIAGEGVGGFKKRLAAWRKHWNVKGFSGTFYMLESGVNLVSQDAVNQLLADIAESGIKFDMLVVDTVARAMVGGEENDASGMGLFIQACDQIRHRLGCGLIAVHHSGKNSENGPRGSSSLSAAVDTEFFLDRIEGTQLVTVSCKKQKDDEENEPFRFVAKKVDLSHLGISGETSLVLISDNAAAGSQENEPKISKAQSVTIMTEIARAWSEGRPWSIKYQARKEGRYLPMWVAREFGVKAQDAEAVIQSLLDNGYLGFEMVDAKTKLKGLNVRRRLE